MQTRRFGRLGCGKCSGLAPSGLGVGTGSGCCVSRAGAAEALVVALTASGFDVVALSPRGEVELSDLPVGPRAAVLFGAEGPGLPETLLARTRTVRIAMAGGFDSLNVATTSGIVLHRLAAARRPAP